MAILALSSSLLSSWARNPGVVAEFPEIGKLTTSTAPVKKSGCGCRKSAGGVDAALVTSVRAYIIGLPKERLDKLKELVKLKETDKLVSYVRVPGTTRLEKRVL